MANPNIVQVTDIKGNTKGYAITNATTDLLENPAASGKVYRVEYLSVANVDGVNTAALTMSFYDASAATSFKIASTIDIPSDSTLMILDRPFFLEEGDKITVLASANGDLEAVISWVIIDD